MVDEPKLVHGWDGIKNAKLYVLNFCWAQAGKTRKMLSNYAQGRILDGSRVSLGVEALGLRFLGGEDIED